jgi:hypothetical protein
MRDYLFRYNRGAFWMGEYALSVLSFPSNGFTRFIFNSFLTTRELYERMHAGNIAQNYFIQDFYYPIQNALEYLNFNSHEMGIYPIWLCPIKATRAEQKLSPHFSEKNTLILNVGIYGTSEKLKCKDLIEINKEAELLATKHNARKMLYAHTYYDRETFWKEYDYKWYKNLREKYGAENIFLEIWEKIHVAERYKPNLTPGLLKHSVRKLFKALGMVKTTN